MCNALLTHAIFDCFTDESSSSCGLFDGRCCHFGRERSVLVGSVFDDQC